MEPLECGANHSLRRQTLTTSTLPSNLTDKGVFGIRSPQNTRIGDRVGRLVCDSPREPARFTRAARNRTSDRPTHAGVPTLFLELRRRASLV
jgi:hypothetical protein